MKALQLKGIFNPLVIPFYSHGKIDYDGFLKNLSVFERFNLSGYVLFGTTGESVYLNECEKLDLLKFTRRHTKKILISGSGSEGTKNTIDLSKKCLDNGSDYILILPSHYYKSMSDASIIKHYSQIADNCFPLIIYNMPVHTNINLSLKILMELSLHTNIVGMKECDPNIVKLMQLNHSLVNPFTVLVGSASMLYPSLRLNISSGSICNLANIMPAELCQLYETLNICNKSISNESLDTQLKHTNKKIVEVNEYLKSFGIPGLKHALNVLGLVGGYPRPPLDQLESHDKDKITNFIKGQNLQFISKQEFVK